MSRGLTLLATPKHRHRRHRARKLSFVHGFVSYAVRGSTKGYTTSSLQIDASWTLTFKRNNLRRLTGIQ